MAEDLDNSTVEIHSLTQGHPPVGVNHNKHAWQIIRANAPIHHWVLHKVTDHKYKLSVGTYHHTGVHAGKVIASTHPEHEAEWIITHHEHHDAYTIALAREPHLGWTVPTNIADGHEIELKPIIHTGSIPPHFLASQLFSLKKH